ncbi:BKRF1 encodes EBNA-1 protein [Histoplasma ohiense]|nr:BKRF1 encodes EBNA-1 protein [Histoplasma ohiense (nom. inval.)]
MFSSCSYFYKVRILLLFLLSLLSYFALVSSQDQLSQPSSESFRSKAIAGGSSLRILPLGDSITYGQGSSDGNGYRLPLYDLLSRWNKVEYIGRERHGSMSNNRHEGHKGFPIGAVGNTGKPDYVERPNIVLLLAGTNDVVFKINLKTAPEVLGRVVDDIVSACPDAVVLVATIPPLLDRNREARRLAFNAALPAVMEQRTEAGKHVLLVDLATVTTRHINATDGIHPVDEGYRLIADAWYKSIVHADQKGWIKAPVAKPANGEVDRVKPTIQAMPIVPGRPIVAGTSAGFWSPFRMLAVLVVVSVGCFWALRVRYPLRWNRRNFW